MIVGISRRSGTNYLASVLLCHRDCGAPSPPVLEDHLLRDAQLLERYAQRAARRWPRRWGSRDDASAALAAALGSGLLSFLHDRSNAARPVSRTPRAQNLRLARTFYRDADILLLVRDGRSVAASLSHAWHWTHDRSVKEWRRGAREILQFTATATGDVDGPRCLVVRYEDLVSDFEATVARVLEFTHLDPDGFDEVKAADLPVLGSSFLRDRDGPVTWDPIPRPADFQPNDRFRNWSRWKRQRFHWLAGEQQRALGYPTDVPRGSGRVFWIANVLRDGGSLLGGWFIVRLNLARKRSRDA